MNQTRRRPAFPLRKLGIAAIVIAVAAGGWYVWSKRGQSADGGYRTETVQRGDVRVAISSTGTLSAVLAALAGAPPPHAILLTHHHNDHIGGVPDLLRHWPGVPVTPVEPIRLGEGAIHGFRVVAAAVGPLRTELLAQVREIAGELEAAGDVLV